MKCNPSPRRTALRITHRTVAIVAGLSYQRRYCRRGHCCHHGPGAGTGTGHRGPRTTEQRRHAGQWHTGHRRHEDVRLYRKLFGHPCRRRRIPLSSSGETFTATESSASTRGSGSPVLYSTGDIEVESLTGTASGSQIAGMEDLNTIVIENSTLASSITGKTASDPIANGIIIYQSTSGDAETTTGSTATFIAKDSTLSSTIQSGSMFYPTNTSATVTLENTVLDFDSSQAALLTASGNDSNNWGQAGSNGASVTVKAVNQMLEGDIVADTISSISLKLTKGSTWTGSTVIEENADASNATDVPISITVGKNSSWIVTGDCTVSNLTVKKGATITDNDGQTVGIVANGQTVVEGTGDVTITVTGTYTEA